MWGALLATQERIQGGTALFLSFWRGENLAYLLRHSHSHIRVPPHTHGRIHKFRRPFGSAAPLYLRYWSEVNLDLVRHSRPAIQQDCPKHAEFAIEILIRISDFSRTPLIRNSG
ncbi:hypothetical protein AVEN_233481-1 [Araneus ventricosus]|uniref:Uncharacterized protein n=1 Tax=Araneus ventricosus TaxID=182803 RepID=A0A4Y2TJE2_ARAVE|nr:hypothetical protein AVEN_233481-1 [Araneus ventricosus]